MTTGDVGQWFTGEQADLPTHSSHAYLQHGGPAQGGADQDGRRPQLLRLAAPQHDHHHSQKTAAQVLSRLGAEEGSHQGDR